MDWKEQPSILNHFLFISILRVENGQFLKPTVLRFEPRLMNCVRLKFEILVDLRPIVWFLSLLDNKGLDLDVDILHFT